MPRTRSYAKIADPSFLNFAAFKAGMTHVMMIDDSESPSKGNEISRPVTVLEIPKVYIYGIRFYRRNYLYREISGEVYDESLAKKVGINKIKKNSVSDFKGKLESLEDVTALAFLDASSLGFGNKRVMRFEMPLGGKSSAEKLAFAEGFLGKEIKISDVLSNGDYIDVTSISKGKGWAGVIKRFGVAKQYRKATGKVRHVGTLGPWHPAKVMFGVPHSGHMGYNYRTELNKRVLRVGTAADAASVNTKGGFLNYGIMKGDFILIDGSVPGPAKRLVRIRKAIRSSAQKKEPQITYLSLESKQGA